MTILRVVRFTPSRRTRGAGAMLGYAEVIIPKVLVSDILTTNHDLITELTDHYRVDLDVGRCSVSNNSRLIVGFPSTTLKCDPEKSIEVLILATDPRERMVSVVHAFLREHPQYDINPPMNAHPKRNLNPSSFCGSIAANVHNPRLSDAEFREFVGNTLLIVDYVGAPSNDPTEQDMFWCNGCERYHTYHCCNEDNG